MLKPIGLASILSALALSCTGCVIDQQAQQQAAADEAKFEASVPRCLTPEQCERAWSAARRWVLDHASYKIQHYTDDYIETFSGGRDSTDTWARVTKEPDRDGMHRIVVEIGCDNPFTCSLSPLIKARQSFNDTVSSAATSHN